MINENKYKKCKITLKKKNKTSAKKHKKKLNNESLKINKILTKTAKNQAKIISMVLLAKNLTFLLNCYK